jgi:DNA-binding transcriptional MerR regulator/effector-binding domain-containing protein
MTPGAGGADVLLTIGEFSKMTYLSVKALRHYHDVGLLAPAAVDPVTGYRRYGADQVGTAQAIRRFRELDMPIDEVRRVLDAPDDAARDRAILVHLERMHAQLERTQATVASLQALLTAGAPPSGELVEIRRLPAARALAARATVGFDDCADWLARALAGLHAEAETAGLVLAAADGALYPDAFFEAGAGEVTAFVPIAGAPRGGARPEAVDLAPATVAVLVHDGPTADLDRAYAALGTVVARRGIGGPGPIREHYLTDTRTEVCWPVTAATT